MDKFEKKYATKLGKRWVNKTDLEAIKLEYSRKLKTKCNDWLPADLLTFTTLLL